MFQRRRDLGTAPSGDCSFGQGPSRAVSPRASCLWLAPHATQESAEISKYWLWPHVSGCRKGRKKVWACETRGSTSKRNRVTLAADRVDRAAIATTSPRPPVAMVRRPASRQPQRRLCRADWIAAPWCFGSVGLLLLGARLPKAAGSWRSGKGGFGSFQFCRSVVSDSLRPHGLQHARPPCPSPTPGVYTNSCPLSRWCHPTISSSIFPFSSRLQSFPASGSFPMSQFFASGCQSIGASASASVLPLNIQDWFPLGWTGWISLQSKRLSRVFSTTIQKHQLEAS